MLHLFLRLLNESQQKLKLDKVLARCLEKLEEVSLSLAKSTRKKSAAKSEGRSAGNKRLYLHCSFLSPLLIYNGALVEYNGVDR